MKRPEYILCAAIYWNDGKQRTFKPTNIDTGIVVLGRRHPDCIQILSEMFYPHYSVLVNCAQNQLRIKINNEQVQGFLTSTNRFVDRKEVAVIAFKAEQTSRPEVTLYSEDIY